MQQPGIPTPTAENTLGGDEFWRSRPFEIQLNAPRRKMVEPELVFDLRRLPHAVTMALELPRELKKAHVVGANLEDAPEKTTEKHRAVTFRVEHGREVIFHGVRIAPKKPLILRVALIASPKIQRGSVFGFDILQRVKGEVVGGSTYKVTFGRHRRKKPEESDAEENTDHPLAPFRPWLLAPPWLRERVRRRLVHSGRIGADAEKDFPPFGRGGQPIK
jgi:hypothetical protein